jgi:hypothetical protein
MKSILQKSLAAALLVASAQAQVHVLSASWRERAANAPTNDILRWSTATPRGYMIFDSTLLSATPGPGTLILYGATRNAGDVEKTYTIDYAFRNFNGDSVLGDSGGRRIYGNVQAPLSITGIVNPMMTFWGTHTAAGYPLRLTFDNTYYNLVSSDALASPQIVNPGVVERALLGGSAKAIPVAATTMTAAIAELEARLVKEGFSRGAVAPVIATDLPATLSLVDGQVGPLSVVLGPNVFPVPTYQWFKNDVAISAANGGTGATLNVTGGAAATGSGTYRVEVSTTAGTAVSGNTVVSSQAFTFATNLPATTALIAKNAARLSVVLSPTPVSAPTYQWFKAPTGTPTAFAPISAANGGTSATLTVVGGEAATGVGIYRVEVTSSAGTIVSSSCNVSVNAVPGTNFVFTDNTPRTFAAPFSPETAIPGGVVNTAAVPSPATATYQWFKAPTSNPTAFVAIPIGNGGNGTTFKVVGNTDPALLNGPGVYRLEVTSSTGTKITSVDTVVTSGP